MQIPDWVWPALGATIALIGLFYGRRRDRDEQIIVQAKINTKIDITLTKIESMDKNITTALGGLDARICELARKQDDHSERIAKVEESAKQAHLRINEIKN
jgi:peptidoglycan hydrolase CwlO-like protein